METIAIASATARNRRTFWLPRIFFRGMLGTLTILLVALTAGPAQAQTETLRGSTLSVCDDGDEWPPYSYWQRVNGKKTEQITGFAVDVLKTIFSRNGLHYSIRLLPWARCLAELKLGTNYQMALNLSYSEERDKSYLLTRPYYSTTNYYYFSRKHHPQGLSIGGVADLKRYKVCGIHGYNYTTYGLSPSEINQRAKNIPSLILMLHLGRCDLFVEKHEILLGFGAIGEAFLEDPELGRDMIRGMQPTPFHMAVSRALPQSQAIKEMLDRELLQMESSGQLKNLWEKSIGP